MRAPEASTPSNCLHELVLGFGSNIRVGSYCGFFGKQSKLRYSATIMQLVAINSRFLDLKRKELLGRTDATRSAGHPETRPRRMATAGFPQQENADLP